MNSLAVKSPLVEAIVFRVISNYSLGMPVRERHVVNTDLIPKINDKIIEKHNFQESSIHLVRPALEEPNSFQRFPAPRVKLVTPPNLINADYRKIFPVLKDPLVTHIECKGPNIPLTVVKAGRNQITNISLTKKEIDDYLNFISEKTRLPLVEGVFNAFVDDYSINAIFSSLIDPSFIIKKNISFNL